MTAIDRIVIEGAIARHERVEVMSEAALDTLRSQLVQYERTSFPILPRGTIAASFDRNSRKGWLAVERQPLRRTIRVSHRRDSRYTDDARRQNGIFLVQIPWQYFVFPFDFTANGERLGTFRVLGSFLFWRNRPIESETDEIWVAPCPNVDGTGSICWGATQHDNHETSLAGKINHMVNTFFDTNFNEDLGHVTPFGQSITQWEEHSRDPLEYITWPFWTHRGSAGSRQRSFAWNTLQERIGGDPLPIAEINPTHVDLPALPENFTVGRARQILAGMGEGQRRRMIAAIRSIDEEPLGDGEIAPAITNDTNVTDTEDADITEGNL